MLKSLLLLILLFCHRDCLGTRRDFSDLGWQAWLLVEPESTKHIHEEEEAPKTRRITPKSVFIAPAFSGSSPLPDCAEGYRADAMGRCVKLVQLNHAAQLNFLLQKLNAMYANHPAEKEYDDLAPSDSNSGPLHVTIPLEMPPEPEDGPKESVEVAVVMADVMKDEQESGKKKPEVEKAQTIVAVWNVGKNGTELEEVETSSDLEMEAASVHVEKSNSTTVKSADAIKYDVVSDNSNSTSPKTVVSLLNEGVHSSSNSSTKTSNESVPEPKKGSDSAMGLLEEVGVVSSEDGRLGNTSRRNVSSVTPVKKHNTTHHSSSAETVVKKTSHHPLPVPNLDTAAATEVQKTSETSAFTAHKPSTSHHVRFPTDDTSNYGGYPNSGTYMHNPYPDYSNNPYDRINHGYNDNPYHRVAAEPARQDYVHFPQPYYEDSNQRPLVPSDLQQRQTYWWLPPGWRLDPTRHQPVLIRFWARMPLLRDPAYQNSMSDSYQDANFERRRRPLVY